MPTYEWFATFRSDFDRLTSEQQDAFLVAVAQFVADLATGQAFRNGLRVKSVKGAAGVFEMTWAPDGRATFEYGAAVLGGQAHIIWRRVGTHEVFGRP